MGDSVSLPGSVLCTPWLLAKETFVSSVTVLKMLLNKEDESVGEGPGVLWTAPLGMGLLGE